MKRTAWVRKWPTTPLKRTPLKARGKKTAAWDATRAALKVVFARAGIVTCELRYQGCWRDNALSFAHSRKRRNIPRGSILLQEVALCCTACHDKIECLPEAEMAQIVRQTIAARPVTVASV